MLLYTTLHETLFFFFFTKTGFNLSVKCGGENVFMEEKIEKD